jgi:serine/threonine protein kinase
MKMTSRIADYELLDELGHGNYGIYYLARPPVRLGVSDDFVAIKVFGRGTRVDPTTFRHAVAELKAFVGVRSQYLVRLLDAGQERGAFYYSMEYLPLGSLAAPKRHLGRYESIRAVAQAARAAHDLHEAGIVHRDIKPGNILLHEQGARLSDLGLAQVLAPGLTVTSLGGAQSLDYLDPAVLRGARPSRASDIWALGVTLHVVLTGVGVYPTLQYDDVLLAMRTVASNTPVLHGDVRPQERTLIETCLAVEAAERPPTALEVAERLEDLNARNTPSRKSRGQPGAAPH